MRLMVCVLLCGTVAVSQVRGDRKGCLLADFLNGTLYDSKFDTSGLQDSYPSERQIRVNCVVGHSGFFKLICDDGTWKSRGSKCQPRPCGHPGDAQFADFHLEGEDFVFGSKVIYTCNKGYQMVSRINYRRCVSEGWDGVVPVCEPVQCPLLRLDDGVLVTGNLEEANFGNVLRFSCKSSTHMLDGKGEIFCDETGRWSGRPPICKVVSCQAPVIENGQVVRDHSAYPEHHELDFRCNPQFQPLDARPSKCKKMGLRADWSPTPACEPIRCRIDLSGTIGTSFVPSFTSAFAIGESVTITCEEDFWIIDKHTTSTVSTCQDNGKWSITPKCLEVTCPNHRPRHVSWWSVYWVPRLTLGARVRYQCDGGFYKTDDAPGLTCTRDGWKPDPPCEERACNVAEVQNADAVNYWIRKVYFDDQATFKCRHDHRQFTLRCTRQGWLGTHPCPLENPRPVEELPTQPPPSPSCPKPKVKNGFTVQTAGEEVYFTCHQGFKLLSGASWGVAECTSGVWLGLEHCIDQRVCGDVPEVPNADVSVKTGVMEHEDVALITCRDGSPGAAGHLSCLKGTWDSDGIPIQNICPNKAELCGAPPQVKDAIITTPYQNKYQWNSTVTYRCRDKFTLEGQDQIQCTSGKWEPSNIKCTAFCFKPMEEQPTMTFHPDQERYLQGEVVDYRCVTPGNKAGGSAMCDQGSWTQPIDCEAKPCAPPEGTTNGNYRFLTDSETTVQYFCNEGFEMVSRVDNRTCLQGKWTNSVPVCEATTCHLPTLDQNMVVINLPEAEGSIAPGHWLRFSCKLPGKVLNGSADLICKLDGRWDHQFPTCEDVPCATEKMDPRLRVSVLPNEHGTIHHGQKLRFDCENGSYVDGAEEIKCLPSGRWSEPVPSCSEPCQLTGVADSVQLVSHNLDAYVKRGEKVQFHCRIRGHNIRGASEVVCQHNGKWSASFPTCGAATENCRSQPTLLDGDVKGSLKSEYEHLDRVEMACQSYYVMEGSPMKTCVSGEWQGDMKCLKPCTVDRDIMNQRHITFRYTRDDKLYSAHDDEIEFMCTRGRMHGDARQRCLNGHMDLPTCQ
ncbi:complement factor H-like [Synchiropus splendidus]|uniref:complement factor H-like n=1 Tax=Synchiropus splendidus TaxID=270530 RepID=UPI00237E37AF|nr:complement factor H-like [Synchiropus splendidus]